MGDIGKVYYVQGQNDKEPVGNWKKMEDKRIPPSFTIWVAYVNDNEIDVKSQTTHTRNQMKAWFKENGNPVE